ncbi:MAG: hypothetical protein Q9181_007470, partial [Wetmoreana brouardii]
MYRPSSLFLPFLITKILYNFAFALPAEYDLPMISSASENTAGNLTFPPPNAHCTTLPSWTIPPFSRISSYDILCQHALMLAQNELASHGLDTEFEFLDRSAPPGGQTTKPKIQLPRKYTAS